MPLPFLIGAAVLAAGAIGVAGIADASDTLSEAKRIRAKAIRNYKRTEQALEGSRKSTRATIEALGQLKINVFQGSVNNFVTHWKKIKNIKETELLIGTETLDISERSIETMLADFNKLNNGVRGVLSGAIAGGASALGAVGLASLVGTASTGASIGSLSGAAATNATLAWLGGGALLEGGLGIAGGAVMLGGLILGPGLLIGGFLMSEKADEARAQASKFSSKVKVYVAETESMRVVLRAITKRGQQISKMLQILDTDLKKAVNDVDTIIRNRGTNWADYSTEEKVRFGKGVMLVKTCMVIIRTPLINEKGNLTKESKSSLIEANVAKKNFESAGIM